MTRTNRSPKEQQELIDMAETAADLCESGQGFTPITGPDDPQFSPEIEIARLVYKKRAINKEIDERITDMVLLMHQHGKSWEKIGHELGITGEAARLRYGKLERGDHTPSAANPEDAAPRSTK